MFTAEELHPSAERLRHARLMAAISNGGRYIKPSKRAWEPADFVADPWQPPKELQPRRLTPAQVARQVAAHNAVRRSSGRRN